MSRGPWCGSCGRECRTKDWKPEPFTGQCSYCGSCAQPVATKPFHEFSKSQIEKWGLPGDEYGCPARYFFKYVLHLPEPKNQYAEFGIYGHALAENWMLRGEWPQVNSLDPKSTHSRAAMSLLGGIPLMPPPSLPGLRTESEFHFEFESIHYMGYKDVWAPLTPASDGPPNALRFSPGGRSMVGDWKFVGQKSFTTYTPTPEKLSHDLQFTIEAFDDVRRGVSDIYANWVYMPRGERNGKPVRAWVNAQPVVARMREINSVAREILTVLQSGSKDPRALRTNPNACKAYNATCPYLDRCHVSDQDRVYASLKGLTDFSQSVKTEGVKNMTQPASPLAALVGSINGTPSIPLLPGQPVAPPLGVPPFATSAAPAAQPPPAATPGPNDLFAVKWGGQDYTILYSQLAGAQASGAVVIGPVSVPATPQPAAPAAPVSVPAGVLPMGANPAPAPAPAAQPPAAAPAPRATRGRRPRVVGASPVPTAAPAPAGLSPTVSAPPAAIPETEDGYDDAVADAIEALNQTLAGGFKLLESALARR